MEQFLAGRVDREKALLQAGKSTGAAPPWRWGGVCTCDCGGLQKWSVQVPAPAQAPVEVPAEPVVLPS